MAITQPTRITDAPNDERMASRATAIEVPATPVMSKDRLTVAKTR